jgi:group I intron endonuclease
MNIYSVYKATNKVNNKVYVGIDKNWPTRRYAHKSKSKLNDGFSLHKAIRKYGWENFDWQIIYQTTDYEHLKEVESILINEYDSFKNG